jgi:hypothetical protein
MLPEDLIRLRHMLDNAKEALELIQGKSRSDHLLSFSTFRGAGSGDPCKSRRAYLY